MVDTPKKIYNFDLSKGFTLTDYVSLRRYVEYVGSGNLPTPELLEELFETIDKFVDVDMFSLDIREVSSVVKQFNDELLKHLSSTT